VPETYGKRKRRVSQRNGKHINGEPEVVAQHRHERVNAGRHSDRHLMHNNAINATGSAASKYAGARYRAKKIIPKNETANKTQMIDWSPAAGQQSCSASRFHLLERLDLQLQS